ncbi:MAG TPA: adenylate/guanylate cyclase domain-containing protein [Chloroflexota bacterium]|nr:adenylate/guanylate cyclase domain-containing protein [Chloroflexota bacterium]
MAAMDSKQGEGSGSELRETPRPEGGGRPPRGTELPAYARLLQPLVDVVAGIRASVHLKLLSGFLAGALLLLGMGVLSLVVLDRMSQRVEDLARLQEKLDRSRQMEYLVTAQSHYRAMALLTRDDSNNDKIAQAKRAFLEHLNTVERLSPPEQGDFFARVREANNRFTASSDRVLGLYTAGNLDEAMRLHLLEEHPISHELEAAMLRLNTDAVKEMWEARNLFASDRGLLTMLVGLFSATGLASSLLLGFVLSWSFIRPVRRIGATLASIAAGNFGEQVRVPNRDEFGTLSRNLNAMSTQLATMYGQLRTLNETLQQKVEEQFQQLERASALKRYLSPQLAESIMAGRVEVSLGSRRKNLTVSFIDIRGFAAMAERLQPEELVDLLNNCLTAMTEIVFKYGGTLDKYIGDTIKVFFGDPVSYEDHPVRAVRMAFELRARLGELQRRWLVDPDDVLSLGIGISTGYVTVGNIGSATRMDYTVVGNHVDLAARLATRAGAGQILITERTLVAVRDFVEAYEIDEVELEGVARPVKIYLIEERAYGGGQARYEAVEQRVHDGL